MSTPWWTEPFRTFQTNLREIDADLDVEAVLDSIEEYGANVWLLSVGGIIANYPSALSCQTVNPVLRNRPSGDLVGDAVTAAAKRGIRVLGRMDFSKIDARRAEEHPEWCFLDATGTPQTYNGYRSVCPSAGYYQEAAFDVISEVLSRYDLGGFFFNWMSFNERDYSRRYWGVCHCEACQRGFRRYAPGVPLPTDPASDGYPLWREFTASVLDDLTARMRAHVRAHKPDAALILGDRADITFHEANNAVGRPLWHHATAEAVSAARSADPERPVFVNAVGFVDMPYRWAGEDPNHFAQYLLQAIAHGAQPSTYVMGTPADAGYQALRIGARITRFHRDNAELYAGLRSAARVGLVRKTPSEDPDAERRRSEFQGCYLSLVESHVPFDVVRQDRLADIQPERYALLILPDIGELADAEVRALEACLAAGGAVVASGDSGWSAGAPQLGAAEPLAVRAAVYSNEESVRSLHLPIRLPRDTDGNGFVGDGFVDDGFVDGSGGNDGNGAAGDDAAVEMAPVLGGFQVLRPAGHATTDWLALGRSRYGPPEQCYGHLPTTHPGWVSGRVGQGRLGLLPWRPGLAYRESGLASIRDAWVAKALGLTDEPLRLRTDLPAQVQVVPAYAGGRTVLHLLNRSGDATQRFLRPLPIQPSTLRLATSGTPRVVRARVAGTDLGWRARTGEVELRLPQLGRFEVVEIQWDNN